ncbi:hypothetical protein OROMI_013070 [Orobanche minor]
MVNSTFPNVRRSPHGTANTVGHADAEFYAAAAAGSAENWGEQPGDALKVTKVLCFCYLIFGVDGGNRIAARWLWMLVEDQSRWESFPWALYSYQLLVTYLSDVPTEVPAGLDPSYHFYGNICAIMIWTCEAIPSLGSKCGTMLGASFIQQPRCTCWKLKKLGHIGFTTFFYEETPEEEQEQETYVVYY